MELKGKALSAAFHDPIREFLNYYPGNYLEIGIYQAYFLTELCSEFPDKAFIGIDPFICDGYTEGTQGEHIPEVEEIALYNIAQTRNCTLFKGKTEDFLKVENLDNIITNTSCVLIDGSHHYQDIVYDIELVFRINNPLVKAVFFDDLQIEDVFKSAVELRDKLKGRIIRVVEFTNGVGIYFK